MKLIAAMHRKITIATTAILAAATAIVVFATHILGGGTIDDFTNTYRSSLGLSTLTTSGWVADLAHQRAIEIQTDFHHVELGPRVQGCWELWGEDIAWVTAGYGTPGYFVNAWINSPPHQAVMTTDFDLQGSAIVSAGGRDWAVQVFIRLCDQQPPAPPPSAPAPPVVIVPPPAIVAPPPTPIPGIDVEPSPESTKKRAGTIIKRLSYNGDYLCLPSR